MSHRTLNPSGLARAAGTLVALLVAFATPSLATTLAPVNLAEMTATADVVLDGWVVDIEARRADNNEIYTYVTVDVLEVIHGISNESEVELRFSGGTLDGETSLVVGMPEFGVGERVLLFVRGNGTEMCPIVGWQQGAFRVATDPESGEDFMMDADGHHVLAIGADNEVVLSARPGGEAQLETSGEPQAFAGVPSEPGTVESSYAGEASGPPMSRVSFLARVDSLRGVGSLASSPPPELSADGIPVDALAPASVDPASASVVEDATEPQTQIQEEPTDDE